MENMDMNNILGQIGFIKERLAQLQEELSTTIIEAKDNEELITVEITGNGVVTNYKLNINVMSFSLDGSLLHSNTKS